MLGQIEGTRRRGWQRMRMSLSKLEEIVKLAMLQSMGSQRFIHDLVTEQ